MKREKKTAHSFDFICDIFEILRALLTRFLKEKVSHVHGYLTGETYHRFYFNQFHLFRKNNILPTHA